MDWSRSSEINGTGPKEWVHGSIGEKAIQGPKGVGDLYEEE